MRKNKIKNLEKKYYEDCDVNFNILIPVPSKTKNYGNPLFHFEFMAGKKRKDDYKIETIYLGIPHFEKEGYTSWRKIECNTRGIELGEKGRWNFLQFCSEHKSPMIEIYPPLEAKYLRLRNLFSDVMSEIQWLDENKKVLER